MQQNSLEQTSPRRLLVCVFVAALALRLIYQLSLRSDDVAQTLVGDAARYDAIGRALAAGHGSGDDVWFQAPLYSYWVGAWYALFGAAPLAVRLAQAVLGAVTALLITRTSGLLFGVRAAQCAGAISALYAPLLYYEADLSKASLAVFGVSVLAWLLARRSDVQPRHAALFGLVAGLCVLTYEQSWALVPLVAGWVAWAALPARRWHSLALAALCFGGCLGGAGARNALVAGEFVVGATNFGCNLFIGNNPRADGLYRPLVPGSGTIEHERDEARRLAEFATGAELSEREVSHYWTGRAVQWMGAEPLEFALLYLRKLRLTLHDREWMDSKSYLIDRARSPITGTLGWLLRFGLLLPLALVGERLARGRRARALALGALLLVCGTALFFVFGRFRIVVVPLLIPFAALALTRLDWLRRPALLVSALLGLWVAFGTVAAREFPAADTFNNVGSACVQQGRFERAFELFEQATRAQPDYAAPRFNLAAELARRGEFERAQAEFERAVSDEPTFANEAWLTLAEALLADGRVDAVAEFCGRVDRSASRASDHFRLGWIARKLGDLAFAEASYRRAIELDPDYAEAHNNLGYLLKWTGREREAVPAFERALALQPGDTLAASNLAWTLAASPDASLRAGERAVELARGLVAREPRAVEWQDLLAAALAESGDFPQAAKIAAAAERMARTQGNPEWAAQIALRRAGYERREPFRAATGDPESSAPAEAD